MIELFDNLKGEFSIQMLRNGKVYDEFRDHNYIMVSARRSVSELFVGASTKRVTGLKLGTAGYLGDAYNPITEANGFARSRECLFTDSVAVRNIGDNISVKTGELISVNGITYQSKEYGVQQYRLSQSILDSKFNLFQSPLYAETIPVKRYSDIVFNGDINYSTKTDCSAFIKYSADVSNTTVEYTFEMGSSVGNDQYSNPNYTLFNEAAIYVNSRIFCMKCFPSKLKDDSTTLKIVWKIIF